MTDASQPIEMSCPHCGNSAVFRRRWLHSNTRCTSCGQTYRIVGSAWLFPADMAGVPIAARVRELCGELSKIAAAPDQYKLEHEVGVLAKLLEFLATPEGGQPANFWAVRQWCAFSGEDTSYAPDELNDVYEDLGAVGNDQAAEENGVTPARLLERLRAINLQLGEER